MKPKLTFLLSLTFLFFFSGSVYGDELQDGLDAYDRKDYKTAYKLLFPFAVQGQVKAQYNLGIIYAEGLGIPQDQKEANKWWRLSAEQGEVKAQYNLGVRYAKGEGVLQDYKEAIKWYRLAAEQEFALAQHNLGVLYGKGLGVLQNYVLAHMWLNLSGSNGIEGAVENRNIIEKRMSKQQIEKAQEMARNWKPEHLKGVLEKLQEMFRTDE